MKDHRDLILWQRAVDLAVLTHHVVESFPLPSRIAYGAQLRRAAASIAANIAEGAARRHRPELVQFLAIARGSLSELQIHRVIVGRLELARPDQLSPMDEAMDHIARMLTNSIRALSRSPLQNAKRPGGWLRTGA